MRIRVKVKTLLWENYVKRSYKPTVEGVLLDLTKDKTGTFTVDYVVEQCNLIAKVNPALRITRADIVGMLDRLRKEGHVELVSRDQNVWRRRPWSRGE